MARRKNNYCDFDFSKKEQFALWIAVVNRDIEIALGELLQ